MIIALLFVVACCGVLVWYCSFLKKELKEYRQRCYKAEGTEADFEEKQRQLAEINLVLRSKREELCRTNNSFAAIQEIQKTKLTDSLQLLNENVKQKMLEQDSISAAIQTKETEIHTLNENVEQVRLILAQYKDEFYMLANQVADLKITHKNATLRQTDTDEGRILQHTDADIRLTDVLDALKLQYPNLATAFAKIQWTEIWQSKFQAMTNDLLKKEQCGIYRIFTISDGGVKSYIGQAKKIRERWSQHIKKMLGIESPDNSKLYNAVKPYTAHFEIVQECTEEELNELEHYWIDFYNCVEDGYNTKK